MAQQADASTSAGQQAGGRGEVRKAVIAFAVVLVALGFFVLCLVSALQLLVLRNAPFGMVGSSQVVAEAQSKVSLDIMAFPNESAAMDAANSGKVYGVYVAGSSGDSLIVVPGKSFFGELEVEGAFQDAARKLNRPLTVQTVAALPQGDRIGAVTGLLLIPLLIGGYLAAVLVFKAAGGTAAAPWRVVILTGYAIVGAVLTDVIAGPLLGAYDNSHFWPLLPCFALITTAVALAAGAIQGLLGRLGSLVVALLFIIVGGAGAGGSGHSLLPVYWQNIGVLLPPQNAINLARNVLYFGGHNITTPLIVLFLYAIAAAAVIAYLGRIRPARIAAASAGGKSVQAGSPESPTSARSPLRRTRTLLPILAALGICAVMQCLFAINYVSASHSPVATDLPFGATGPSPVLTQAEKQFSLKVTQYDSEPAAMSAIDRAEIWGALVPSSASGTPSKLIVVPSISDLAPGDLALQFEDAAKKVGQPLTVQQYAPKPLAKKDPFGLVPSVMLLPLYICSYVIATLVLAVTGKAASHWRAASFVGFAIVGGLIADLVVGLWLQGFPSDKFWIVWPICSLVMAIVAFVAGILQKLFGAVGTLLTVVLIVMFGNPSSGGANGVPYLPTFWRDIGPYLPPRNAYVLLHQTIYFDGHGTTEALLILLAYLVVAGAILGVLDWRRSEAHVPQEAPDAAAMTAPIGATP